MFLLYPPLIKRLVLLPLSAILLMYVGNCMCLSREWFFIVNVDFVENMGVKSYTETLSDFIIQKA